MSKVISLKIEPIATLMDENCAITCQNLGICQTVSVLAIIHNDEDGTTFYSHGEFITDSNGNLEVDKSFSYRGTYVGVESMGIFWSAIPAPGQKSGLRLIKRVPDTSLDWDVFVIDGSIDGRFVEEIVGYVRNMKARRRNGGVKVQPPAAAAAAAAADDDDGKGESFPGQDSAENFFFSMGVNKKRVLAEAVAKRYYCYPSEVEQIPIRDGRVRGIVFRRKDANEKKLHSVSSETLDQLAMKKKGLIEVYGGGSFKLHRGALLAQRGYVVFNLAYCDYDDLPRREIDTSVDYFIEAVEYMLSDRFPVRFDIDSGIGLIGLCKGATLLLELAAINPRNSIKAVVAINAPCFNSIGSFKRAGCCDNIAHVWDLQDPLLYKNKDGVVSDGLLGWFLGKTVEEQERIGIPVERIDAEILFVNGMDDLSIGVKNIDYMVERLRKWGRRNYRCLVYPGAGHLIDPPVFPLCRFSYWPLFRDVFVWGGEAKLHHGAQLDSWKQILEFFRCNLS